MSAIFDLSLSSLVPSYTRNRIPSRSLSIFPSLHSSLHSSLSISAYSFCSCSVLALLYISLLTDSHSPENEASTGPNVLAVLPTPSASRPHSTPLPKMAIGGLSRFAAPSSPAKYVTYLLRQPEQRPRSGVNALAFSPTADRLYAAGRDGVVRAWDTAAAAPSSAFHEHADWVNDVLVVHNGSRVVSASSDTSVKVWNAADGRESLRTLSKHTDYVKALAPLADGAVVSGALDGRVLVWDLATGRVRTECGGDPGSRGIGFEANGSSGSGGFDGGDGDRRSSVYCLASCVDPQASTIVSGSTDRVISVYDARSGDTVVNLRGHTDAIRCLNLKHDSTLLLSGSSDATVRLWDLRQQRCLRTYDSHPSDSVWALDALRSFETFVSGGRDGSVWHCSLDGNYASLVVAFADVQKRSNMILDVAIDPVSSNRLWVSTTGSTVRQWAVPPVDSFRSDQENPTPASTRSELAASANGGAAMDIEPSAGRRPKVELTGLPAVVGYKVMNNRRHVMTCDTSDEVCIWDVTNASLLRSVGKLPSGVTLDELSEKHEEEVAVPSWFKVDIRLGSVAIKLGKSSVGEAELYAVNAGLEVESVDTKINVGDHILSGLFSKWKTGLLGTGSSTENPQGNGTANGAAAKEGSSSPGIKANGTSDEAADAGNGAGSATPPPPPALPPYVFPPHTPIILTDDSPIPVLSRTAGDFTGQAELDCLPPWVVDVVRDGRTMGRDGSSKIWFSVFPVDGSGLPELPTVPLTAPQVLRIRKVAGYVAGQLNELLGESLSERVEAEHLDILCHGKVLPPDMNLATTRKFKWLTGNSSGEMSLTFRNSKETPPAVTAGIAAAVAANASGAMRASS